MYLNRDERKRFYEGELLREAPRLLARMDRCPVSASKGCLDREYWAWATRDFPNADMQRALWVLAYLFDTDFPGNEFRGEKAMLKWIEFGVGFWISKQAPDGSFDHLYPYEKSWMAAAFTLTDLLECYALTAEKMSPALRDDWLEAMKLAGEYLTRSDETHGYISNHRAGAAAGLLGLANLTGVEKYRKRGWELINGVYERQSPEGWFLEYEGADPGYQTLDTHYQSLFYLHSGKAPAVLSAVERSLEFLSYFVHPDGSIGGEYGSRNCPHFFPGGFEVFASSLPMAEAVAGHCAGGLSRGNSCGLADSDGRNSVPMATSYVLAHRSLRENSGVAGGPQSLPFQREFERLWPQAGIYVRSDEDRYAIFGASKGGVVKVFSKSKKKLIHSSCGYAGRLSDGRRITTHLWTSNPEMDAGGLAAGREETSMPDRSVCVSAGFFEFRPDRTMRPFGFLLFRAFNLSVGRVPAINRLARKLIIGAFIGKRKSAPLKIKRTLEFRGKELSISDRIEIEKSDAVVEEIREHGFFSTIYMASARYFRRQDFEHALSSEELAGKFTAGSLVRQTHIGSKSNSE